MTPEVTLIDDFIRSESQRKELAIRMKLGLTAAEVRCLSVREIQKRAKSLVFVEESVPQVSVRAGPNDPAKYEATIRHRWMVLTQQEWDVIQRAKREGIIDSIWTP